MKIFIGYVSITGNTEEAAKILFDHLREYDVVLRDLQECDPHELINYDCIFLGSPTYGDGEIPSEIKEFYDTLSEVSLQSKFVAAFGTGSSYYEQYCVAVDALLMKMVNCGGKPFLPVLKLEEYPLEEDMNDFIAMCQEKLKEISF